MSISIAQMRKRRQEIGAGVRSTTQQIWDKGGVKQLEELTGQRVKPITHIDIVGKSPDELAAMGYPIAVASGSAVPQATQRLLEQKAQTHNPKAFAQGQRLKPMVGFKEWFEQNPKASPTEIYSKLRQYQAKAPGGRFSEVAYSNFKDHFSNFALGLLLSGQFQAARDMWGRHAKYNNVEWLKWLTASQDRFYGVPLAIGTGLIAIPALAAAGGGNTIIRRRRKRAGGASGQYLPNDYYNV